MEVPLNDCVRHVDIALGNAYPSDLGTARVRLVLTDEIIRHATVEIGYLHRGFEKSAEAIHWQRLLSHTERLAPRSPHTTTLAYVLALERLMGLRAPRRARWLRVLVAELARMVGHLSTLAAVAMCCERPSIARQLARAQAAIRAGLQPLTQRTPAAWACVGGVTDDLPAGSAAALRQQLREAFACIGRLDGVFGQGRYLRRRLRGRGVLHPAQAVQFGVTGPLLRSCGVAYDVRQAFPYDAYDELFVQPAVAQEGDCYARWRLRLEELAQSRTLVQQVLDGLPQGALCADDPRLARPTPAALAASPALLAQHQHNCAHGLQLAAGATYSATESVNGELGFYLVSDGSDRPRRVRLRAPSFWHMQAYEQLLLPQAALADVRLLFACANIFGDARDR